MRKSKQRLSKGDRVFTIFVNVITVFILILVLYPLYFVIIASISNPELVNSGKVILLPQDITFVGYQQIFKDSRIWSGYLNTFLYTSCGTILALILTIGGGYSLSRKSLPGGPLIMKLLVFTMYFQGGLIPTYMIVKNLGLVDTRGSTPYHSISLSAHSAALILDTNIPPANPSYVYFESHNTLLHFSPAL